MRAVALRESNWRGLDGHLEAQELRSQQNALATMGFARAAGATARVSTLHQGQLSVPNDIGYFNDALKALQSMFDHGCSLLQPQQMRE